MVKRKFDTLMENVKRMETAELLEKKEDLYNVTFAMTEMQLKEFTDYLVWKNAAYREEGNVFIYGIYECIF